MIFETLYQSAERRELILVEGGYCRYHLRKDGQLTIYELLTIIKGHGIGLSILNRLKTVDGAHCILTRCPVELNTNKWYAANGFVLVSIQPTNLGRLLNV